MKKLLLLVLCCIALNAYAQETVTLIVSSDGKSKDDAIKNALRSAIEQTYGTFVSTNTTILNDDLVKDEIATIASGNVESYKIISSATLPNGNTTVSLEATISYGKLISYARSKGAECELSTSTYLMNLKLKKLNELNVRLAVNNLFPQLREISKYMYDYEIDSEIVNVDEKQETATIRLKISVLVNENAKMFMDFLQSSLKAIGEKSSSSNNTVSIGFCVGDSKLIHTYESFNVSLSYHQLTMLRVIFDDALYNFEVYDNLGNKYFDNNFGGRSYAYDVLYDGYKMKKVLEVSEDWNWTESYDYLAKLTYPGNDQCGFSVVNENPECFIVIPRVLCGQKNNYESTNETFKQTKRQNNKLKRQENESTKETFKPIKIDERITNLTLPLETFANITNFRIEACGNQYQSIIERLCQIKVVNQHDSLNYIDLGLPSGTKWAVKKDGRANKAIIFAAPIKEAVNYYGSTHIPTYEQFKELIDNCTFKIADYFGNDEISVHVIGPNGKSIYIKLAGIIDESRTIDPSTEGKSIMLWVCAYSPKSGKYIAFKLEKDMQTGQLKPIEYQFENPNLWHYILFVK